MHFMCNPNVSIDEAEPDPNVMKCGFDSVPGKFAHILLSDCFVIKLNDCSKNRAQY